MLVVLGTRELWRGRRGRIKREDGILMMDMNRGRWVFGVYTIRMGDLYGFGTGCVFCAVGSINSLLSMHGVARYEFNSSACWKYVVGFTTKRPLTTIDNMSSETATRRLQKYNSAANTIVPACNANWYHKQRCTHPFRFSMQVPISRIPFPALESN